MGAAGVMGAMGAAGAVGAMGVTGGTARHIARNINHRESVCLRDYNIF